MASSEKSVKEKPSANSRARRHSNDNVVKKKRSKKDKNKDSDTESLSSTNSSAHIVVPEPRRCPLRFVLAGLCELEEGPEGRKLNGCPLRRVQLWHTIPLCLLAIINLLLVIMALLGLASYRIAMGVQSTVIRLVTPESPYADSAVGADDGPLVETSA